MPKHPIDRAAPAGGTGPLSLSDAKPFADPDPGHLSAKDLRTGPTHAGRLAGHGGQKHGPAANTAKRMIVPGKGRGR